MATINEELNSGLCTLGGILGMEVSKSCITQMKKARSVWYIKPGEEFRAGETYASELSRLILAGSLQITSGVDTFEEAGNEDTIDTSDGGVEAVTQEGLYKFNATYTNGLYFNKAQHKTLKGFKRWNVIIVTQDGMFGTETTTGGLTGFTTGMIQPTKVIVGTSSTSQKEGTSFQFLEPDEFNSDYAFRADTTSRKQKGVTQIEISLVNAPADTDVVLTVKAVHAQNRNEVFTGEPFSNFIQSIDGGAENPTAGDDTVLAGTYVLTIGAITAGEAGLFSLGSGNNYVVVGVDGDYYRSNILSYIVA